MTTPMTQEQIASSLFDECSAQRDRIAQLETRVIPEWLLAELRRYQVMAAEAQTEDGAIFAKKQAGSAIFTWLELSRSI